MRGNKAIELTNEAIRLKVAVRTPQHVELKQRYMKVRARVDRVEITDQGDIILRGVHQCTQSPRRGGHSTPMTLGPQREIRISVIDMTWVNKPSDLSRFRGLHFKQKYPDHGIQVGAVTGVLEMKIS